MDYSMSCDLLQNSKRHVLTMTVRHTKTPTKFITIYSILSLTAFKRVNCCWVSWFHTPLYLVQPDCRDMRRLFALRPTELLLFPRPRSSFQENVLHGFFYWINGNIRLQTSLEKRSDYWTIQISQALPNFAIFAMAFQWTPVSPRDL